MILPVTVVVGLFRPDPVRDGTLDSSVDHSLKAVLADALTGYNPAERLLGHYCRVEIALTGNPAELLLRQPFIG